MDFSLLSWGAHVLAGVTVHLKKKLLLNIRAKKEEMMCFSEDVAAVQVTPGTKRGRLTCMKGETAETAAVSAPAQKRSPGPARSGCRDAEGQGTFSDYNAAA